MFWLLSIFPELHLHFSIPSSHPGIVIKILLLRPEAYNLRLALAKGERREKIGKKKES